MISYQPEYGSRTDSMGVELGQKRPGGGREGEICDWTWGTMDRELVAHEGEEIEP